MREQIILVILLTGNLTLHLIWLTALRGFTIANYRGLIAGCWNPGSEAVDAFTVDWSGENNWWCPPIGLIPRVIRHAQACHSKGSMVVPLWLSAPFWPLLCPYGSDCFAPFVRECKELPQAASLFIPGLSGAVLFNGEVPNTKVLALHCDLAHQFLMDLFPV